MQNAVNRSNPLDEIVECCIEGWDVRCNDGDVANKPHVEYIVRLRSRSGRLWRVYRRFNDFVALLDWLQVDEEGDGMCFCSLFRGGVDKVYHEAFADALPGLPSKVTLLQKDQIVVRERVPLLEAWLKALLKLQHVLLHTSELQQWLGMGALLKRRLLYKTKTVCARCTLIDGNELSMVSAQVVSENHQVFLCGTCAVHGPFETLYCSDSFFFERMTTLVNISRPVVDAHDIEDVTKRLTYKGPDPSLPLSMELVLVQQDHRTLWDEAHLAGEIKRMRALHGGPNHKFVVRMVSKACTDMEALNQVALVVQKLATGLPLLLEATVERLLVVCQFSNSVFLKGNVYPAIKYFLTAGKEATCVSDLQALFANLQQFRGIQVVLTVAFDWPLPSLAPILHAVASAPPGFVRMLILSPERAPSRLVEQLGGKSPLGTAAHPPAQKVATTAPKKKRAPKSNDEGDDDDVDDPFKSVISKMKTTTTTAVVDNDNNSNNDNNNRGSIEADHTVASKSQRQSTPSVDPVPILEALEREYGLLSARDFFPASCLATLEPFLRMLGYGNFSLRAHPYCGFVACLVTIDKVVAPITRYMDMSRFFSLMMPLLPQLKTVVGDIPWTLARKLKNVFQECYIQSSSNSDTDLASFFTDPSKAPQAQAFLDNMLFVVWHNNMDIASFDLVRRCECAAVKSTQLTANQIAATCTGCI